METPVPPTLVPADPAVFGAGLARVLDAVSAAMPRQEVDGVWSFPGLVRDGKEYGVAVVTRRGDADRLRVYRARYTLNVKGQDRGKAVVELEETAEAVAETVAKVIDGVARRADEAGEAEVVELAAWKAADGDLGS